jgi:MFS family permease
MLGRLIALFALTLPLGFTAFVFPLATVFLLGQQNVSAAAISLNGLASGAALLLGLFIMPGLLGRLRPAHAIAIGIILIALPVAASALYPVLAVLLGARFIYGLGFALHWGASESWINRHWPPASLGRAMGFYMLAWYIPLPLAPLLMLYAKGREAQVLFALALLMLLTLPLLYWLRREAPLPSERPTVHWHNIKLAPLPILAAFLVGGLEISRSFLLPVYLATRGLDQSAVLYGVLWAALGGIGFNILGAALSDRLNPRRVLWLLATTGLTACVWLIFTAPDSVLFPFWLFILGGGLNGLYPLVTTLIGREVLATQRVAANTALMLSYTLGLMLLPVPAGWLMDIRGAESFTIFSAILFLIVVLLTLALRHKK